MTSCDAIARLHQKVAVITGASSGLGRAIAFAYALQGAKLVVCADLQPTLKPGIDGEVAATHEEICKRHGDGMAVFVHCDVTKTEDVERAVKVAAGKGGRLDM